MKKIIVTGATSMIGIAVIECALNHDVEVFAIVNPNTSRLSRLPSHEKLHLIECDISKLLFLPGISDFCDCFYHFAWSYTKKQTRDDPVLQFRNVQYTLDAVCLALRCGCRKFIGAGSQAEYGIVDGRIDNNTKFYPQTSYGISKFAAGLLSRKLCKSYNMINIWARIFSVYGRFDNSDTMLDYAIRNFAKNEVAYFSEGSHKWDYLNEVDAGRAFYLLGEKCNCSKEYRIASGNSRMLIEFIKIVANEMNAGHLCKFVKRPSSTVYNLEADITDLREDIGFIPEVSFEDGIKEMISYYKNNII